jgi:hypothetical protein
MAPPFLLSVIRLRLLIVPACLAAHLLRRRFGNVRGALAAVFESMLAVSSLIVLAEALGIFGELRLWWVIIAAWLGLGAVAAVLHFVLLARRAWLSEIYPDVWFQDPAGVRENLLGEDASGLWPSSIQRLTESWQAEHATFSNRKLRGLL